MADNTQQYARVKRSHSGPIGSFQRGQLILIDTKARASDLTNGFLKLIESGKPRTLGKTKIRQWLRAEL